MWFEKGSKRLNPGGPIIYEDGNGKAVVAGILSTISPDDCSYPPSDLSMTNVFNIYGIVVP